MKNKFNFGIFKNVQFVETSKTEKYENLMKMLKQNIV
jgi:hypothetical protein